MLEATLAPADKSRAQRIISRWVEWYRRRDGPPLGHVVGVVRRLGERGTVIYGLVFDVAAFTAIAFVTSATLSDATIQQHSETILAYVVQPVVGRPGFVAILVAAVLSTASAIHATLFATARLAHRVAQDGELQADRPQPRAEVLGDGALEAGEALGLELGQVAVDVVADVVGVAFEALLAGAVGCIWGATNAMPKECVILYDLVMADRLVEAKTLWERMLPANLFFWSHVYNSSVKAATNLTGGKVGECRKPVQPLKASEMAELKEALKPLEVLPNMPMIYPSCYHFWVKM